NGSPTDFTLESDSFHLTGEFNLGFATLRSLTQYRDDVSTLAGDYDNSAFAIMAPNWEVHDETITQEFNLTSEEGGRLSWILGLYYYKNENIYPFYDVSAFGSPK